MYRFRRLLVAFGGIPRARTPACVLAVWVAAVFTTPGWTGPIGSPVQVCASGAYWPAVCYNATADQHLVLWVDVTDPNGWQLKGHRFDPDTGTVVGSEFYISPDPADVKAIIGSACYNSTNGEWFVVYQGQIASTNYEDDVLGQRIAADGTKIGGYIPLVVKDDYQNDADVAWDPVSRQYLVVWSEKVGGYKQVKGRFFDQAGSALGAEFRIRDTGVLYNSYSPKVAYNPVIREFLVIWQDYRNYTGSGQDNEYSDIYGQRVDAATRTKIGGNIPIYWGGSPYVPNGQDIPGGLVCSTNDGRYFIPIQKLTSTEYYRTYGLIINYDGTWHGPGVFDISRPDFGVPTGAVYSPVDDTYFATYEDLTDGHPNTIRGRQFSAAGIGIGGRVDANTAAGGTRGGALAVRPSDGQYVQILCTDAGGAIYAQRFVSDYVPLPPQPPQITYPTANSETEGPKVRIEWTDQTHDKFEVHVNTTNVPTDAGSYDSGEVTSSTNFHETGVLAVGQDYYAFVRLHNIAGWSQWSGPGHRFRVVPNTKPPAPPADLCATGTNAAVRLAWTNPPDKDLSRIEIRSRGDRCPTCPKDGALITTVAQVAPGAGASFVHSPVANGVKRYYAVFAVDEGGLYSAPACASAAAEQWAVEYHADALPSVSAPVWTVLDDGGSESWAHIEPGGVLHVLDGSTDWGSKIRWYRNWAVSNAAGATVLVRARCDSVGVNAYTTNVTLSDGGRYINFVILPDRVASKADATLVLDREHLLDGTAYHTYRFTLRGSTYACYTDESPNPVFTGTAYTTANRQILFGANGSQATQSIYFDYLFYRTDGAFAPADESDSVQALKRKPDGTPVALAGALVTACFDGFFYAACEPRMSGIRVVKPNHGLCVGDYVDIRGTLGTTPAGERCIESASVTVVL